MLTLWVDGFTFAFMHTLQDVIEHFGGTHRSLAEALGVHRATVTMWGGEIPPNRAYQIEVLSKGKFKAKNLPVRGQQRRSA